MKRFLAIIILGLLLSTSTHAGLFKKKTWLVKNDWDKSQYWNMCKAYIWKEALKACNCDVPDPSDKQKAESEALYSPLHKCLDKMEDFGKYKNLKANPVEKTEEKKTTETSNKTELIIQAKKTCLDLGFTAGTEKFGDCTLKVLKMKSQ